MRRRIRERQGPMVAIDTNLLLYAFDAGAPLHARARGAIEQAQRAGDGWGVAFANLLEFWSVGTRVVDGKALASPDEALGFIRALVDAGAEIWQGGAHMPARLFTAAREAGVRGRAVYDLPIALAAMDHGARELWTNDRAFTPVPGLRVVFPLG